MYLMFQIWSYMIYENCIMCIMMKYSTAYWCIGLKQIFFLFVCFICAFSSVLRNVLLGISANRHTHNVHLDLSCNDFRASGANILEICFTDLHNVTSLDISDNGKASRSGTRFTKGLWAHNWNLVKIILIVIIQSVHKFAHVMIVELSWHVQNCDLIW